MPVRQEQHVDAGQVDGQPLGVGEPDIAVGADVEQHGRRAVAPSCRGECGEAVTGDAEMVEGHHAVVTVVLAARRDAPEQYAISGSCGMPGSMLDSVSVALSTTIVMVSSSSSGAGTLGRDVIRASSQAHHQPRPSDRREYRSDDTADLRQDHPQEHMAAAVVRHHHERSRRVGACFIRRMWRRQRQSLDDRRRHCCSCSEAAPERHVVTWHGTARGLVAPPARRV